MRTTIRRTALNSMLALLIAAVGLTACVSGAPAPSIRDQIVELARSQVGVAESPLGSNNIPGNPYGNSGRPWCAYFTSWVWIHAGVQGATVEPSVTQWINGTEPGTWKPGAANNPQPGDAVAYDQSQGERWPHIGIVETVNGNMITTIEGNSGDAVTRHGPFDPRTHSYGGHFVGGYLAPPGASDIPSPSPPPLVPMMVAPFLNAAGHLGEGVQGGPFHSADMVNVEVVADGHTVNNVAPWSTFATGSTGPVSHVFYETTGGDHPYLGHAWVSVRDLKWHVEQLYDIAPGARIAVGTFNGLMQVYVARPGGMIGEYWTASSAGSLLGAGSYYSANVLPTANHVDNGPIVFAHEANIQADIFYKSTTPGVIGHVLYNKTWHAENIPAVADFDGGALTAVEFGGDSHVFYTRTDHVVGHAWWTGTNWGHDTLNSAVISNVPVATGSQLDATVYGDELHLVSESPGHQINHSWYNPTYGWNNEIWTDMTLAPGGDLAIHPYVWSLAVANATANHAINERMWNGTTWTKSTPIGNRADNAHIDLYAYAG